MITITKTMRMKMKKVQSRPIFATTIYYKREANDTEILLSKMVSRGQIKKTEYRNHNPFLHFIITIKINQQNYSKRNHIFYIQWKHQKQH
uniref:MIP32745p1 n=1 Tax=Drosophila melanogaster TaxID=7227 RepID=H1UUI4_DROME|nr:MIP32745p1 [Drosophila melanogaster]